MGTLDGKSALVSGSGRGIGREIALRLASEGASVVVNDLDPEPAERTAADIRAAGGTAAVCVGSVTTADFSQRFVDTAVDTFGGLDIIVNNAGYTWDSVIQKMSDEQWDTILDVNLTAPFRILRAAQPYFRNNPVDHHRKVVNIASTTGFYGAAGQSNYGAAKAGLVGLTKVLAKEWGRYRVNVNAVAFGFILTRMTEVTAADNTTLEIDGREIRVGMNPERAAMASTIIPFGRPGTAKEAAGAVYLLCTPDADYINSQCIVVDAGRV
ncbi:SDR family oxidoreductase [Streptomyces sp. NPDC047315]|uniref:SDR family NAD(P)-dependent oxidoreductase n=1 Tax=Streptomyces sp. NPDC047315 TaxID=3155142 RepID=UPI0033F437E7